MIINNKFEYKSLERITQPSGVRHYHCPETNTLLPSVTTILDKTIDKSGIQSWKDFVGEKKAAQIIKEATDLGTLVHTHIENHILGIERPRGTHPVRIQSKNMADKIIEQGLCDVDEVWGQEVGLYYPGLYAGTTDLLGVYKGKPCIMDHKTAKKLRTKDMIEAYLCQIAAYALAHNQMFGTDIQTGAIFMVDREFKFQIFHIEEEEMKRNQENFLNKVERYYELM